jgi:isopropylmalate/homocitrate/citramalate synthase
MYNIKNTLKIFNFMNNKKKVQIYEMFMRDGLQSLSTIYPLTKKLNFLNNIYSCNIKNIEFGSTTSEKLLPQMGGSFDLWNNVSIDKTYKLSKFTMLITDKRSLIKSLNNNIISFGLLSSISDSFAKNNLKTDASKSFENMMEQFDLIYNNNKRKDINNSTNLILLDDQNINENKKFHTRLYLSCSFGGQNENLDEEYLNKLNKYILKIYDKIKFYNLNDDNVDIVLCDTMGILDTNIFNKVISKINEINGINKYISLHLHTDKNFYKYIDIALLNNIYKFDSSILNIGGCPFSGKKNIGNINTLDLATYLEKNNYDTGINIDLLKIIEKKIENDMKIN